MGTWGHKTFENDYSLDWVSDLPEKGWPYVEWTFDTVVQERQLQFRAASGEAAVAAIESVLVALGEHLPEFLEQVPSSLSDLENKGPLASIIREEKSTRGQIFIYKRLQSAKSDRLLAGIKAHMANQAS